MSIALFGGSFDPPHIGHVRIALAALTTLEIDKLIIVPAYRNPLKHSIRAHSEKRVEWLKTIFAPYTKIEISDFEIRHKRPVYTIETVEHYEALGDKIYLIIGADNLETLPKWDRFELLKKKVTFVVATRQGYDVPKDMISLIVNEPISSTLFRDSLSIPLGFNKTLENDIYKYYKENHESTH